MSEKPKVAPVHTPHFFPIPAAAAILSALPAILSFSIYHSFSQGVAMNPLTVGEACRKSQIGNPVREFLNENFSNKCSMTHSDTKKKWTYTWMAKKAE